MKPALFALLLSAPLMAQRTEIGLTLGRYMEDSRGALTVGSGTAFQANYGYRLTGNRTATLFFETHFLASPQRVVSSSDVRATRDVATIYLTPGFRLKLLADRRVQPYLATGAGLALHEHSTATISGAANPAPREQSTGVFNYGASLDLPVLRWIGARFEVRDFVSGNPVYNVPVSGKQHNIVAGGGFVLRF